MKNFFSSKGKIEENISNLMVEKQKLEKDIENLGQVILIATFNMKNQIISQKNQKKKIIKKL